MAERTALGQRIRLHRIREGHTLIVAAGQIGVDPRTLRGWEATGQVRDEHVARLAAYLGEPVEAIAREVVGG